MLDNIKFLNRLAFLIASVAMSILAISFLYYATQNWFQIERVVVQGNISHITKSQISYILQNKLHGTFFTLNIDAVQDEFQGIPWVKSVLVTREFPDSITVNVEEYTAIASLGGNKLLSEDKQVFDGADKLGLLPIFDIPDAQIDNAIISYEALKPFLGEHNVQLKSMFYNGVGLIKVEFSDGLKITICGSDLNSSLALLNKYWSQLHQIEPNLLYINMCYKDAIAIR